MRLFLTGFTHFICLAVPIAAVALDSGGKGKDVNKVKAVGDLEMSNSGTSFLNPTYIFNSMKDTYLPSSLRMASAIQAFVAPRPPPPDFWDRIKEYEDALQDYVPRLLEDAAAFFKSTKFDDISSSMNHIVTASTTFRNHINDTLHVQNFTLDTLTEELERVFMNIVHSLEDIPPPDKAPGHAERTRVVDKVLDDVAVALMDLAHRHGIDEEAVTSYLAVLRPHVEALTVAIGDINEQHPKLFPILAFTVAALLIPESWILRPFLSLFGFGPSGPVRGSAAAFLQRIFWGAKVAPGSWFSMLQAVGMGILPKWAGLATKLPLWIGGILAILLSSCFGRRTN